MYIHVPAFVKIVLIIIWLIRHFRASMSAMHCNVLSMGSPASLRDVCMQYEINPSMGFRDMLREQIQMRPDVRHIKGNK